MFFRGMKFFRFLSMRSVPSAFPNTVVVHFVVQPGATLGRLPVLAKDGEEPRDVAARLVDPLRGVPLGLLYGLVSLAAGTGDGLVVCSLPSLIILLLSWMALLTSSKASCTAPFGGTMF